MTAHSFAEAQQALAASQAVRWYVAMLRSDFCALSLFASALTFKNSPVLDFFGGRSFPAGFTWHRGRVRGWGGWRDAAVGEHCTQAYQCARQQRALGAKRLLPCVSLPGRAAGLLVNEE